MAAVAMVKPGTNLQFKVVTITPAMARELLEKNRINRAIRPYIVKKIARHIKAGRWMLTHQPIAIDEDGNVLDGQHRLLAIVEADAPIQVVMATSRRETFGVIDQGQVRTAADVARLDPKVTAVGNTLARMACGSAQPDKESTVAAATAIAPLCSELVQIGHKQHRIGFTTAGIKAGAIADAIVYDKDFAFGSYRNLVEDKVQDLTTSQAQLYRYCSERAHLLGNGSSGQADAFCRSAIAFNEDNADLSRLMVRRFDQYFDLAKKALHKVGIKKVQTVNGVDYPTAPE